MTKYNDIKRVRDIKTLVCDTRQVRSVNRSVTLATMFTLISLLVYPVAVYIQSISIITGILLRSVYWMLLGSTGIHYKTRNRN